MIQMLWIRGSLSKLEQLAIRSFLAQGHQVDVYTYDACLQGLPEGLRPVKGRVVGTNDGGPVRVWQAPLDGQELVGGPSRQVHERARIGEGVGRPPADFSRCSSHEGCLALQDEGP